MLLHKENYGMPLQLKHNMISEMKHSKGNQTYLEAGLECRLHLRIICGSICLCTCVYQNPIQPLFHLRLANPDARVLFP